MVFNLQLFAWTFDTGVGLFDNNTTIRVMDTGGATIKADVEASAGVLATGTNFSIGATSTWGEVRSYMARANDLLEDGNNAATGWSNSINWNMAGADTTTDLKLMRDGFGNLTGIANSGMSFGVGIGNALTDTSVQAIRLTGRYMFDGTTETARAAATVVGNTDVVDTFRATTADVLSDLRYNGSNLVVEAKSQYLNTLNLNGLDADVKLTTTENNLIAVNGVTDVKGNSRKITFGDLNTVSMRSADANWGTNNIITTTKNTAEIVQNSQLTGVTVVGRSGEDLTFHMGSANNAYIRFGTTSDTINVRKEGATSVSTAFENVEQVNMNLRGGTMRVVGLAGTNNVTVNTNGSNQELRIANSNLQGGTIANTNKVLINVADHNLDQDDIRADGAFVNANLLTLGLSGAGVESVNIGTHGANATATNWVMSGSTPTGAVSSNIVSIGDHGILAVEGDLAGRNNLWVATHWNASGDADKTGENGDPSRLQITTKADGNGGTAMGSYEYMNIAAQGNTYKAMVVSDDSLKASDTDVNFGVDIVVGDFLNLGDRTDKKVVFLNNGLGKNDWGETVSYSANMTTVKSSTAGGSLIIGDFENSVSLYGAGDQDSLFGGNDYEHDKSATWALSNYDTLASAAKKKAWMGTSEYSGLTLVDLVHNGQQTNNFGFLGENDETEKTGDVLALMNGAGFTSLKGSEHQLVNFAIGADSANHFMFQSVTEGSHDIMYTYDLGKNNYNGRVDTSLLGSKSGFEYDDSIDFYLGFDKGTVLSFDSSDKNQKLNYDGGAVLMGISTIDGAAGGAGNILNGQENHAEYIAGSATAANTLCGGLKGDADTAADTLVGGSAADTFWVGATMGNDVINNVTDGDTIVFLNSKFADATITHNMLVPGDASVYNVSFSDEAGGATVNLNTVTGKKLSDFKSLTIKFDDATYAWNGTEWSQS